MGQSATWPRGTDKPEPGDVVAVLMTEEMARRFEERCLGVNTRGPSRLSPPLLFREDDVPTYIIEVGHPNGAVKRIEYKEQS